MCLAKLRRRLSLPVFVLVLGLAGPALLSSSRAAYASPGAAKEPAAEDDEGIKVGPDLWGGFFRAVKHALGSRDVAAMALLVHYPLRLNYADGSTTALVNARALETRFDEAFPPDLRAAVAHATEDDVFDGVEELGILNGRLSAELFEDGKGSFYKVTDVNSLATRRVRRTDKGMLYACETEKHNVVIDIPAGELRYRAWNKPHRPPDKPDMEITGGTSRIDGILRCRHTSWIFTRGDTTYDLGELGCRPEPGEIPDDARAELSVEVRGKTKRDWLCF